MLASRSWRVRDFLMIEEARRRPPRIVEYVWRLSIVFWIPPDHFFSSTSVRMTGSSAFGSG